MAYLLGMMLTMVVGFFFGAALTVAFIKLMMYLEESGFLVL